MRNKQEKLFDLGRSASAILLTLAVAIVLIFLTSSMPGEAVKSMLISPLSSNRYIWHIFERMIPTIFTGLAVCIMYASNQFNLASEGTFYAGGIAAASIAIFLDLPKGVHTIVAVLAAMLVGMVLMLVPSVLSVKLGANVLVTSLMLNYIILQFGLHITTYIIRDPGYISNSSYLLSETALIPSIKYRTSWGLLVAVIMIVICGLYIYRTRWGYAVRTIGANRSFAQYAGISVGSTIIVSQLIAGAIAAMGGAIEVLGFYKRFEWSALPGYGWTGVTIAIIAKNNPWKVPLASFFLAYLEVGCELMQIYADIQPEIFDIIKAVIFLFFAAEQFMAPLRQKLIVRMAMQEEKEKAALNGGKA